MRKIIIQLLKILSRLVTYLLLALPHKKKYIVFSSKYGFSDNSKYLFLYYLKKNANCVWVASDLQCYTEVQKLVKNYPNAQVIKRNSIALINTLARTKYVFVTHSFLDLGPLAIKSCTLINLWHGIPLKKMGYDSPNDINLFSLEKASPYQLNDYVLASSEVTKPFIQSSMKFDSDKVLPLGQPRNDFLFENLNNEQLISKLKKRYSAMSSTKTFLYAPTFRDQKNSSKSIYTQVIQSFAKHSKEHHLLILRLHPKERALLLNTDLPQNVQLSVIADIQEELLATDILISDYSSLIFDFSILKKAIFLYIPDKEEYFTNRGGCYFNYEQILQECYHIQITELDTIWNSNENDTDFKNLARLHKSPACKSIYKKFN